MAYGLFFFKISIHVCLCGPTFGSVLFGYELVFVASVQIQALLSDFVTVV